MSEELGTNRNKSYIFSLRIELDFKGRRVCNVTAYGLEKCKKNENPRFVDILQLVLCVLALHVTRHL